MKAILCEAFAPLDQLTYKELPDPVARKGEVVIDVAAAGVNFPDGLLVQGLYQMKPPCPFVPGTEIAGTISAVGEGVNHLKAGDRVVGVTMLGGYAEKAALPASTVMPLPDAIPFEEAAGLITAHATAHHALKQRANLQAGETLLVTGAAGGTGLAAVQIGKAMGARVIAVCSSAEKLAVAQANGADVLINASEQDLKEEIKKATGGQGVDVAYEVVGGDTFDTLSRCMAWNGRLLVIGFASGRIPELPVNLTLVKGYAVLGVFWGTFTQKQPKDFIANMMELIQWYLQGKVKVVVDQCFPLENAVDAINKVMNRQVMGKVILTP
ncbi:NADPH:quinone oxidoreductase family protein [Aestuariirhabdus litorea]|uniref:NADPH:quinone oxidoreductase family protein n=1 Tax=Aestuariirhabdus litorea TaxID=2528527 RepID=A0A3P3VN65_9GAMM|nr:NADPH:quinone oxidoreductase family protein [Aestuariirhabdus litorea]RRJ83787.1 NADPH:quinone oxidoreductase family protein [Aestuariirhabdus litorea]RWW97010.1 NADPH:quinone oxidoreductase family protein [Endozoicomonadaceae bacterium GTF-13]